MLSVPEKMIRKCLGVRRRSREEKKVILRKTCYARFLGIMCRKNGVCVGTLYVRVITAEKGNL